MSDEIPPAITLTVKEFRMWLEGVEEMQAEGWVPDARQWQRIRDKINTVSTQSSTPLHTPPPPPPPIGVTHRNSVMYDVPTISPPVGPSVLNTANRQQPPSPETVNPLFSSTGVSGSPARTPDIDTGNGKQYESSFA